MNLFVNARFLTQPISGVQRYGIECSLQIKRLYPDTIFLTPPNILHYEVANVLNAVKIGNNSGHLWEQVDLPVYLRKNGNPLLLSLANTAPLFYSNNLITIHDLAFYHHPEWNTSFFSMWYNFLLPRLAKKARHIFTVSNTIRKEIEDIYKVPTSKISVTYNGISQTIIRESVRSIVPKEKIILCVGTFNIRKNQQNLISGFRKSYLKHQYKLVLIGDRNKVFSATGLTEENLKEDHIEIITGVSDVQLIEWYHKAIVVASLSEYEGFGIPLLEGLFFGCKILCSDIAIYRELFGEVAQFCNPKPENTREIARKLEEIVDMQQEGTEEKVNLLLDKYNYRNSAETIMKKVSSLQGGM